MIQPRTGFSRQCARRTGLRGASSRAIRMPTRPTRRLNSTGGHTFFMPTSLGWGTRAPRACTRGVSFGARYPLSPQDGVGVSYWRGKTATPPARVRVCRGLCRNGRGARSRIGRSSLGDCSLPIGLVCTRTSLAILASRPNMCVPPVCSESSQFAHAFGNVTPRTVSRRHRELHRNGAVGCDGVVTGRTPDGRRQCRAIEM